MNDRRPRAIALSLLLALAACSAPNSPAAEPPLAGARIGGPFALTDPAGNTVRDSDFVGKYRIMYFGYSFCPDVCPTDLQNIGVAMRMIEQQDKAMADRIVPIFITVDPERDTPEVVGTFVRAFSPRIIGLTGTPEQIANVAKDYAIPVQKGEKTADGGYLVSHTNQAYLMGPDNQPIALLPADESGEAVAAELRKWVQ